MTTVFPSDLMNCVLRSQWIPQWMVHANCLDQRDQGAIQAEHVSQVLHVWLRQNVPCQNHRVMEVKMPVLSSICVFLTS